MAKAEMNAPPTEEEVEAALRHLKGWFTPSHITFKVVRGLARERDSLRAEIALLKSGQSVEKED